MPLIFPWLCGYTHLEVKRYGLEPPLTGENIKMFSHLPHSVQGLSPQHSYINSAYHHHDYLKRTPQ